MPKNKSDILSDMSKTLAATICDFVECSISKDERVAIQKEIERGFYIIASMDK